MRKRDRFLILAVLLTASLSSTSGALCESTGFQTDAAHDGYVSFHKGFNPPLRLRWERNLAPEVSYPIIAQGLVIVTAGSALYALSVKTGETIWQKLLDGGGTPAYDRGKIFIVSSTAVLQAYDAASGKTLWVEHFPDDQYYAYATSPVASHGHLFVMGSYIGSSLYSFNERSGHLEWLDLFDSGNAITPALGDNGIFVVHPCNYFKLDPTTGNLIWRGGSGDCEGGGGAMPVYFGNRVFVRDVPGSGDFVLDSATGATIATFTSGPPPALFSDSGRNYMVSVANGQVACTDPDTGTAVWSFAGDGQFASAASIINNVVAVGSQSGELYLLDRLTGAAVWSTQVGAPITNSPVTGFGAGNGTLIVPASNELSAFAPQR